MLSCIWRQLLYEGHPLLFFLSPPNEDNEPCWEQCLPFASTQAWVWGWEWREGEERKKMGREVGRRNHHKNNGKKEKVWDVAKVSSKRRGTAHQLSPQKDTQRKIQNGLITCSMGFCGPDGYSSFLYYGFYRNIHFVLQIIYRKLL